MRVALLSGVLVRVLRRPAQEPSRTRGSVTGTVSLCDASQEPSTSYGLQLRLQPLAEGAASLSAITDEAGNYEFKEVADGDRSEERRVGKECRSRWWRDK